MALRNGLRVSPWLSHNRALMMVVTVPRRTLPTLVPLTAATAENDSTVTDAKTNIAQPSARRTVKTH
jgi:hypothetical protein